MDELVPVWIIGALLPSAIIDRCAVPVARRNGDAVAAGPDRLNKQAHIFADGKT